MIKSVMIVEDEFVIATDLCTVLTRNSWRVIGPHANVLNALRALETERPTVGLLDVNLGSELVTPVAVALRSLGIPFALATSYEAPEKIGGEALAGVPNVGKPVIYPRLLDTLTALASLDRSVVHAPLNRW